MKSIFRILSRYVLSAAAVAIILLILNFSVFIAWLIHAKDIEIYNYRTSEVSAGITRSASGFELDDAAQKALETDFVWGMLLDDGGQVIWQKNMPDTLPHSYSVSDVASFSRWYLADYPVYVWLHPDGLLVLAKPENSIWKHGLEMQSDLMQNAITWLPGVFLLNSLVAVLLSLLFGLRLLRALQPLARGIEDLAQNRPLSLATRGMLGDLSEKLNRTSLQLQNQAQSLQKRDNARTNWISGISHDIRTPLSLVMGYASQLENNTALSPDEKEQAHIIRSQSEKIKNLVNDLNLASRLEYDMQPLYIKPLNLAALLRAVTADFLNSGLDAGFSIELLIEQETPKNQILADEQLIKRAVSNLINNSIRHNPQGTAIQVCLKSTGSHARICVRDFGSGFSPVSLKHQQQEDAALRQERGLGLTIVRQIIKAHDGWLVLANLPEGGCLVEFYLPCRM